MLEKIKDQYLLFDTNLIIAATNHPAAFSKFKGILKENNITPGYDEVIKLEFLRTSRNQADLKEKIKYLRLLFGSPENEFKLPIIPDIIESARQISILINHLSWKKGGEKNQKKLNVSAEDCLIAAQLQNYRKSTYLATLNNKHFPTSYFERIAVIPIEDEDEIFTIGIYGFSVAKHNAAVKSFEG